MSRFHVLFVLPTRGGGGGANSVAQEAMGLSRMGVQATVAVNAANAAAFSASYPELRHKAVAVTAFDDAASLGKEMASADIACATTCGSVSLIEAALSTIPEEARRPKLAYYVQDYEPLFHDIDTPVWREAFASYTRLPQAQLFAKTDWIRAMVEANHQVTVAKVDPSIDHEIFFPDLARPLGGTTTVVAMLRPRTSRRGPYRTARLLAWLAKTYGDAVAIEVFGTSDRELATFGIELPSTAINHGPLRRTEVPEVLRRADLFLDLSDYQAFGRTALEAMACGCNVVVPVLGGAGEFARHGWNAFVVDTRSDAEVKAAIGAFMAMDAKDRDEMRLNALATAADFTVEKAALSELRLFRAMLA